MQWSDEQKKRAFSRLFQAFMERCHKSEKQLASLLDVNQATVNRWKTLVVRPGRDKLIELLKNVFALGYDDIDAMLWLAGLPEMTREECRSVMGSTESFRGKTESELQTRASKLISEIISETLGLPGTEDGTAAVEAVQDLTTKTNGKKQSTAIDWRKDEETHRKSSLLIASMSWFAGTIHRFRAWREQRKLKQLLEGKREAKAIYCHRTLKWGHLWTGQNPPPVGNQTIPHLLCPVKASSDCLRSSSFRLYIR